MLGRTFFWMLLLVCGFGIDPGSVAIARQAESEGEPARPFESKDVAAAEKLIGLELTDTERALLLDDAMRNLRRYETLRSVEIGNEVMPAIEFDPVLPGMKFESEQRPLRFAPVEGVERPATNAELAFLSVGELGALLRAKKLTSTELTKVYLERLRKYGPRLECVVTLTEELALEQARRADAELAAGKDRGPLHGIPYGAKDLLAVPGYPTTWGAEPYRDQRIEETATVIQRLEDAGAVLVAKLTLGALAWGDVWFGGMTRNPWKPQQGSSGSSAGSASATAAGLVAFSIGSETWGSIVSPSTRCGVTGLRPTYGRVSRHGAMALSWTMDKLGPICRTVDDCARVFHAIHGPDGVDGTLYDVPFNYDATRPLEEIRVGFVESAFAGDRVRRDRATLDVLRELGVKLIPVELPELPVASMAFILNAEAAAAFDGLTRSNEDDRMVRQMAQAWPNAFRTARFVPAVEYIQANRLRTLALREMAKIFEDVDVYVAPSFSDNLLLTNLTGHPAVVLPNGANRGAVTGASITLTGNLFAEGEVLAVARRIQEATEFHRMHPDLDETLGSIEGDESGN